MLHDFDEQLSLDVDQLLFALFCFFTEKVVGAVENVQDLHPRRRHVVAIELVDDFRPELGLLTQIADLDVIEKVALSTMRRNLLSQSRDRGLATSEMTA